MVLEQLLTAEARNLRQHISQNRILSGPYGSVLDEIDPVKYNSGLTNWRLAFADDSGRRLLGKTATEYVAALDDGDFFALPTFGLAYTRIKELGNNIITKLQDPNTVDVDKFRAKLQEVDVPELGRLVRELTAFTYDEIYSLVKRFNNDALRIGREALQTAEATGKKLKIAAPIASYGDSYTGEGFTTIVNAVDMHLRQIEVLKDHVDLFLFETNATVEQAVAAAHAGELSGKPYIISFVVDDEGYLKGSNRTHTVADAISIIEGGSYVDGGKQRGIVTYGINCSSERGVKAALRNLRENEHEEKVRLVYLNASKHNQCRSEKQSHGHDNMAAEIFAQESHEIKTLFPYVTVASGCCGITPKYLPILRQYLNGEPQAAQGHRSDETTRRIKHDDHVHASAT